MNSYGNGSSGIHLAVEMMALQTLHRTWQDRFGAPDGTGGGRLLQRAVFFALCVLPLAAIVVRALAF